MWWIASGLIIFIVVLAIVAKPLLHHLQGKAAEHARRSFRLQREVLEARFFTLASSLGKPRGLRWLDCQWQDQAMFARDRQTGLITAFVGVNIRFEAIEGSDMEDVAAVGTVRDACAMFHYQNGNWGTGGRALFNMDPSMALQRFQDQYESLEPKVTESTPIV